MNSILRIENAALAVIALYTYYVLGFSWAIFGIFILAPDLAMLGYLVSTKIGAICYNIAHSWILACGLILSAHILQNETLMVAGLILAAHIGIDRAIGYGLKHYSGFKDTHLGSIGR